MNTCDEENVFDIFGRGEQNHPPAVSKNGLGGINEHGHPNGGKVTDPGQIHDDAEFVAGAVADKGLIDLVHPINV